MSLVVMVRHLPAVGLVSKHGERRVGEVPQDVHGLPLQLQRLLHELLLALHEELHRLSQRLQRLRHRGQEHPAGPLLLQALRDHLRHVVLRPARGRSGWEGFGCFGA